MRVFCLACGLLSSILISIGVQADVLECSDQSGHKFMLGEQSQIDSKEVKCRTVGLPGASGGKRSGMGNGRSIGSPVQVAAGAGRHFMVTKEIQAQADNERKKILQQELMAEQARLKSVTEKASSGVRSEQMSAEPDIHRIEQNISAIKRELSRLTVPQ